MKKIKDVTFFDVAECCSKYSCESCPLRLREDIYTGCILYVADHMLPIELKELNEKEVNL